MSELTLFKSGSALPDHLRGVEDFTKSMAGGSGGKSISIEGGVWRMIAGGEEVAKNEDRSMNFVVVNGNPKVSRVFYAGQYVKGQASIPECYSKDGKAPAENAVNPQSDNCATCPQNIKGSGQGDARACRFMQRIAVVLEGDMEGNVYRLQLPAKSIFGEAQNGKMPFQAYAKFLNGHGVPMSGVVTEARFDTSEAVPVLKFTAVRPLNREEYEISRTQGATKDALDAIEVSFTDSDKNGVKVDQSRKQPALPASFEQGSAPAPAMAEPAKRPTKRSEQAAPPKSVDQLMDEWGSDDE